MVSSRWWIGELRIVGFANVPSEMLPSICCTSLFIKSIDRLLLAGPQAWFTCTRGLKVFYNKPTCRNMSAQRWLNKFKHVHWSTTGKAYVSCLLNIQNLLFCRRDAREATKRGHKTGSALVVPLASLVLVSAVDDEWHWGDDKFSQRRYM